MGGTTSCDISTSQVANSDGTVTTVNKKTCKNLNGDVVNTTTTYQTTPKSEYTSARESATNSSSPGTRNAAFTFVFLFFFVVLIATGVVFGHSRGWLRHRPGHPAVGFDGPPARNLLPL